MGQSNTGGMLVRGQYVLVDPSRRGRDALLADGAVLVERNRILAVGPYEELHPAHPGVPEIGSQRHLVLPGFVNAHHHGVGLSDTRLGLADSYLERWIIDGYREPAIDPYLDTLWGDLRNLRSGVTSVLHTAYDRVGLDYEGESRAKIRAHDASGIRAVYGVHAMATRRFVYGADTDLAALAPAELRERFLKAVAGGPAVDTHRMARLFRDLRADYAGNPRIVIALAPLGAQWSDELLLRTVRTLADEASCPIHLHCLETRQQCNFAARAYGGRTMIEHLDAIGFLDAAVTLGHAVWLTENDAGILARRGVSVAHNAGSNLRLGSGIMPLAGLCACGVNVGIGLDGMTLGDDDDMLSELRLVGALHRQPRPDAPPRWTGLSDAELIERATLGGARTLGLHAEIGTLKPGRRADLITLDLDRLRAPYTAPGIDPVTVLVQRARTGDVDNVVVDGRLLMKDGVFTEIDERAVLTRLVASARNAEGLPPDPYRMLIGDMAPYVDAFYDKERGTGDGWIQSNRRR